GPGVPSGGCGVAPGGLLDVPGHEPGPAEAAGALRIDVQPQLRGPAGQGRSHPPRLTARRGGDGGARHVVLAVRPRLTRRVTDLRGTPWRPSPPPRASGCRCDAATSTPTRSSRPSTSSA